MDEFQYFSCFKTFYAYDGFRVLNSNENTNDQLCRVITQFDDDRDLENTLLSYCKNTPQYRDLCCGKKSFRNDSRRHNGNQNLSTF